MTRGMLLRLALASAALASTTGCVAPQRANLTRLQQRAVFDLSCPPQQLVLYHIDGRTKAVAGCGRQLVYLERCDSGAGNVCSWQLDSPNAARYSNAAGYYGTPASQAAGYQPTGQAARAQWAMQPGINRPMPTQLFEPGREPEVRPTKTGPATRQRTIRTDLYSREGRALQGRPAKRPIATELFEEQKRDGERKEGGGATDPAATPPPPAPGSSGPAAPTAPPPTPPTPYDAR